jgi:hypothetical protein
VGGLLAAGVVDGGAAGGGGSATAYPQLMVTIAERVASLSSPRVGGGEEAHRRTSTSAESLPGNLC